MPFVLFTDSIFTRSDMHNAIVFAFVVIVNQHHFLAVAFFDHHHFISFVGMTACGEN